VEEQAAPVATANPAERWKRVIFSVLIVVAVLAMSVGIFLERDWIRHLGFLGYPGIFLVALLASAAMFAPMPGLMVLAAASTALNPFWAALLFAIGASLGELSGYIAGIAGRGVVQRSKWYDRMEWWMKKYGGFTILILGFIPNFLIDMAGMVAGALKMPWYKFALWCFLGKLPKSLLVSYGGLVILRHFHLL
jgi:membrane protein DedA with SNARE-associated domain